MDKHPGKKYTCLHCKGTGRDPLPADFLDILSGDWASYECPNCRGTGKVSDPRRINDGTGWFG